MDKIETHLTRGAPEAGQPDTDIATQRDVRPEPALLGYGSKLKPIRPLFWPTALWLSWREAFIGGSLVLALFFIGWFALAPELYSGPGSGQIDIARDMVRMGSSIATQLELYRINTGRYPPSLSDLTVPIENTCYDNGKRYIKDPKMLIDPWGNPLQYRCPGVNNPTGYDLWSMGPDGKAGGDDDIGNWPLDL